MRLVPRPVRAAGRLLLANGPELLTSVAALAGWALLTGAVARWAGPVAWAVSGGLLLFSLAGWKLLGIVAWNGLLVLSLDDLKAASKSSRKGAA